MRVNRIGMLRRLFRKAVQQGRSEGRDEVYSVSYVEPLSDARMLGLVCTHQEISFKEGLNNSVF